MKLLKNCKKRRNKIKMHAYTHLDLAISVTTASLKTNMHIHAFRYAAKFSEQLFQIPYAQIIVDCAQYRYTKYVANVYQTA